MNNLWVGASRIHLTMQRGPSRTTYRLTRAEGPAVEIRFSPEVPHGMQIGQVLVNGTTQPLAGRGPSGLLDPPLAFTLEQDTMIDLRHRGGLGAIPRVPRPEPGAPSQGYRLIREGMDGEAYTLTVEGPSGTTGCFSVKSFGHVPARIDGAERVAISDDGVVTVRVSFDEGAEPFTRTTVRFFLQPGRD